MALAVQQPPNQRLRPFKPTKFGRYTLMLPLATGGMGEVYLARIESGANFEKYCVIKKILPHLAADADFVERFIGEARVLAKLSHGNIAQVLDMGHVDGAPYLALEFVDGKDVRRIIARMRDRRLPVPVTFALYTTVRVLEALAYAHRKRGDDDRELGLVHRDISPQNLLVSYEGEVKIIDFGLAKSALSTAKTNPSVVLGKFLYMSPEQARSARVDRRSDLYSVGLCLYEMIAGKNPFEDVPHTELLQRVQTPNIPPLSQVEPLCPPALSDVVMRALSVDPQGRYQSAEEFRAKLLGQLLELDPAAGPETASRFMREAFAAEVAQEKKVFAQFREGPVDEQRSATRAEARAETQAGVELNPFSKDDETNPGGDVPPPSPSRPDGRTERESKALGLDNVSPSGKRVKLQTDIAPALPTMGLTPVSAPSVLVDDAPGGTMVEPSGSETNPVLAKVKGKPKPEPDKEVTNSAVRRLRAPSSRGKLPESDEVVAHTPDKTLDIDADSEPRGAALRKPEHTEQDTGDEVAASTDPDGRSTALRGAHKGSTPLRPSRAHDFKKIPLWAWLALPGAALLLVLLFILWDVWSETSKRADETTRRAAEERRVEERRRELLTRSARGPEDEAVEPLADTTKQREAFDRVQRSLDRLRAVDPRAAERRAPAVESLRARLPTAATDATFMSDVNKYYQSIEVDLSSARAGPEP